MIGGSPEQLHASFKVCCAVALSASIDPFPCCCFCASQVLRPFLSPEVAAGIRIQAVKARSGGDLPPLPPPVEVQPGAVRCGAEREGGTCP